MRIAHVERLLQDIYLLLKLLSFLPNVLRFCCQLVHAVGAHLADFSRCEDAWNMAKEAALDGEIDDVVNEVSY